MGMKLPTPFILFGIALLASSLLYVQAQETGQPYLVDLFQKTHEDRVSQRPHESGLKEPELIEKRRPVQPLRIRVTSPAPPTARDKLAQGWRSYRKKDYPRSIQLFTQVSASSHGPTAMEAKLGLAYSYLKQGRRERAKDLFEELVKQRYKVEETLPNLLPLLLAREEYPQAKPYLALLPDKQRSLWQKKFQEAEIRSDYQKMAKPAATQDWNQFVQVHQEGLDQCVADDVFAQVAGHLAEAGAKPEAASLYGKLLQCPELDWKMRMGIVYGLAEVAPLEEMESLLAEEKKKGPMEYRAEVGSLELSLLRRQLAALPPGSPEAEKVSRKILALQPRDPAAQSALAWTYFNQGKYEEAHRLFSDLHSRHPGEKDHALGLAYTKMKMGRDGEALALAEKVPFKDEEWEKVRAQLYLKKAREAYEKKDFAAAESFLAKALAIEPENADARVLLAWTLHSRGQDDRALSLLRADREKGRLSSEDLKGLNELELGVLRKQLAALPPSSPRIEEVARRILALQPGDPAARRALAWMYYNQGKDREAYQLFSSLHKEYPDERDYALGLIYTQMRMGKTDEALALAERVGFQDKEWQEVRAQLYLKKAWEAYDQKKYAEAQTLAGKALAIQPENQDARLLSARTYLAQGKPKEALPLLLDQHKKSPTPELEKSILSTYEQMGERKKAFQFADSLGKGVFPASPKAAAEYYASHDAPVRAAQTHPERGTCYYNADKPSIEGSFLLRYKSGSDGFDKLIEANFPVTFDYPLFYGKKWSFSLIPAYLDSGSAPYVPYAGSYYKYVNGGPKQNDLVTTLWTVKPEVGFQMEDPVRYGFLLGTSFIGGPVSPLPTFTAGASGKNWLINVHQLQVDESLLSYAGQKDPYTDKEWGRVLRTGIDGNISFEPWPYYWLLFSAGYDYLWGENVWSNQSVFANASFGKFLRWGPGDLSAGWFVTFKHYQRNTNFFTYGHGGYFSPEVFFITGPTLRYKTTPCATCSIDASASVGYMYYETKDSPHYPLFDDNLSALSGSAQGDATGTYSGENVSRLGLSGKVRGVKLFGNHWLGSAYLGFNNASSYNEWRMGISLQYFFDSITNAGEFRHFLLREPEDRFQRFPR
jgi:thioredoxin-like negative regulator of GroEL